MADETDVGSAEVQPARDNQPKATNGHRQGSQNPALLFDQIPMTIQSFAMPKKTSTCQRPEILPSALLRTGLTVTGMAIGMLTGTTWLTPMRMVEWLRTWLGFLT